MQNQCAEIKVRAKRRGAGVLGNRDRSRFLSEFGGPMPRLLPWRLHNVAIEFGIADEYTGWSNTGGWTTRPWVGASVTSRDRG